MNTAAAVTLLVTVRCLPRAAEGKTGLFGLLVLEVQSVMAANAGQQEREAAGHTVCTVRRQREKSCCPARFLLRSSSFNPRLHLAREMEATGHPQDGSSLLT